VANPDEMPERGPMYSQEAEQAVLGALLLDNKAFDDVADMIGQADFYVQDHGQIFRAIFELINAGKAADVLTVHDWLVNRLIKIEDALKYLNALSTNTPGASGVMNYARIVRERALRRALVGACRSVIVDVYAPNGRTAETLVDEAQGRILAIAESNAKGGGEFPLMQHFMSDAVMRIQDLSERESDSDLIGLSTGFAELDRKTAGLSPGDLVIIAGRPSMGKTALALNIAEHVALKQRKPVGVFSMEMPGNQLAVRMMAGVAGLNQHRVRRGKLNAGEWEKLSDAVNLLSGAPIHVDESSNLTPNELRARARRLFRATKGTLGLIVLDYLQLMAGNNDRDNRVQQIGEITRAMKLLAKELSIPVIALSQLNRELEKRTNRRPQMSDLRDGGGIEQDADLILFIYRDEVYNEETSAKGVAEIIVGKQRNGPVGTVKLSFHAANTRFSDLEGGY